MNKSKDKSMELCSSILTQLLNQISQGRQFEKLDITGRFVCSPSYAGGNRNIPLITSDVYDYHGKSISIGEVTSDVVYMPISDPAMECGLESLDLYLSEFSFCVISPPVELNDGVEVLSDMYQEKLTDMLIDMRYTNNYVLSHSEYIPAIYESKLSKSCAMLSDSVFSSLNIIFTDSKILTQSRSRLSYKLEDVLVRGLIPVAWQGTCSNGNPIIFRDLKNP
jgi:hypothetical protein